MTREEFKTLVKGMKAVYAQPTFIPDQDAFNVWFELLKDIPYQQANVAIQKYMLTEKFPPTIADIREKATQIVESVDSSMSELEAWSLVRKAVRNSGYHSVEEFEKLPEACQRAVGSAANLKEWALMDSERVETVEQSHFIRNYRTTVQRISEEKKLPESIRLLIASMRDNALELEKKEQPMNVEPLPDKTSLSAEEQSYNFLFYALYSINYTLPDPAAITVAERDSILKAFRAKMQQYVDGLSVNEIVDSNIKTLLSDKATELANSMSSEKISLSYEISSIEIHNAGTEITQ